MSLRSLIWALVVLGSTCLRTAHADEPFVFTKVDLKLLEECDALDRQLEKHALVLHDAALEKYLAELGAPMLPKAPLEHVAWRFHILRDPMVNAFAAPNGSIYVFSGLLARTENDDQLAAVLGHEITHVTKRHAYIFNRSLRKKFVASEVLAIVTAAIPGGGAFGASVTLAANMGEWAIIGMVFSYSRELEEEADRIGFERLKGAGRDTAEMVRMMQIMDEKLEPEPVPRFFWTHPRTKDRIAYLKEMAGLTADPLPRADVQYADRMRPVIEQNIQLDLDSRRYRSALAAAQRVARAHPDDAVAMYWLGESYRLLGPREPRLSEAEQTDAGLRSGYGKMQRRTEAEDNAELAKTPDGRAALERNQRQAEELLTKTMALNPSFADPHFALGALYEERGKPEQAIEAYQKYVELSLQTSARDRAERRIAALKLNGAK
jgi:predicted Zn-dependent protease